MIFSRRTDWELTPNALHECRAALERDGTWIWDLTQSNPTRAGFHYPPEWLAALADPGSLVYDPDPSGWRPAREAVASLYAAKGVALSADRIVLTSSTSEAYSHLFRLLADPGDEVLVPCPSYPLFGYLAQLNDLKPVAYPVEGEENGIADQLSDRTRACVVVHPNNPTGSCWNRAQMERMSVFLREHNLPLIADEVFAEHLFDPAPDLPRTLLGGSAPLVFALGGLSKFLGLPQMKLGWMACSGDPELVSAALARLEVIADTYLSPNTPAQRALPKWLKAAPELQAQIQQRLESNRQFLRQAFADGSAEILPAQGGWSAVLRVPSLVDEEAAVLTLLEKQHTLVHPGYFFDFDRPGFLVVSLLPPPEIFQEGIRRIRFTIGV